MFFDKYPECQDSLLWKYQLSAYLEFDLGGDISHLSSLDFNEDHVFPGEDILVTNGYDKITDYLKRELDIQLNSKVKSINYRDDKIIVIAEEEVFEADYVIVTVPLGVLKKNIIEFTLLCRRKKNGLLKKSKWEP